MGEDTYKCCGALFACRPAVTKKNCVEFGGKKWEVGTLCHFCQWLLCVRSWRTISIQNLSLPLVLLSSPPSLPFHVTQTLSNLFCVTNKIPPRCSGLSTLKVGVAGPTFNTAALWAKLGHLNSSPLFFSSTIYILSQILFWIYIWNVLEKLKRRDTTWKVKRNKKH